MNPETMPWADRPELIALAERALAGDDGEPGLWSHGTFFPLTPDQRA